MRWKCVVRGGAQALLDEGQLGFRAGESREETNCARADVGFICHREGFWPAADLQVTSGKKTGSQDCADA